MAMAKGHQRSILQIQNQNMFLVKLGIILLKHLNSTCEPFPLRAELRRMGEHRLYRRRWYILLLFATMSMYQGEQHFKASCSILKKVYLPYG
jgi:hypothetical protein